jgi:hypothetical protein
VRKLYILLSLFCLGLGFLFFSPFGKKLGFNALLTQNGASGGLTTKKVIGARSKSSSASKSSVVIQKVDGGQASTVSQRPNRTVPEQASPMDRASADELRRFPTAKVLKSGSFSGPGPDQTTRVRILDTDFKYPYVRTEEVIQQSTGEVLLREEMVADHLLVTLEEGQDPAMLLESMGDGVSSVERVSTDVPLFRVHLSSLSMEALPTKLDLAGEQVIVVSAEPDYIRQGLLVPNDPKYLDGTLWGLNQASDADVDAPEGWDVRTSAGSIVVAVIDTGVRYTHQDLAANMWVNSGEARGNGVDDDGNGVVDDVYGFDAYNNDGDPMDDQSHGTHCAGTIGGVGNNGIGITGVAWGVKVMACKFLSNTGSGTDSDAIRCIDYARSKGAKVLSNSWGGGGANSSLLAAIERCRAAGVLFVAAAGNESNNNDSWASYPASYTTDNIISVAATTRTDALASFSNYGATSVDLGAPGDGIYSTVSGSNSAYATYSGTSMATPHVAGALAMIAAQYPTESYTSLISRLLSGTDKIGSLSGKTKSGGRMNLAKSLGTVTPPQPTRPLNDSFGSATSASGSSWSLSGSNVDGTSEVGEPAHAGSAPAKSVWWTWTSPSSGTCTLSTSGSAFDTILAVYQGMSIGALSVVASNDNSASGVTTSSVSFPVTMGAVYLIVVDGKSGASGSVELRGSLSVSGPANDAFASAVSLSGTAFTVSGSNVGATSEVSEPRHAGQRGRKSVWWNWTAPSNGRLTIATTTSTFDTLLGIYTGSVVGSLTRIGSNDDESRSLRTSRVTISVEAGTIYRIAVDGYQGDQGSIRLAGTFQTKSTLTAPTGLSALRDKQNRVVVSWGPVQEALQYEINLSSGIQIYASGVSTGSSVRTSGSIPSSIALTAKVRAISETGVVGPWSDSVAVR